MTQNLEIKTQSFAKMINDPDSRAINKAINSDYHTMLAQLASLSDAELSKRVRAYDSHQRFTLGRANTEKMAIDQLMVRVQSGAPFKPIRLNDHSSFLHSLTAEHYPALYAAIVKSTEILTNEGQAEGSGLISVYCHRVVVTPGHSYKGFLHRDNKKGERCGTLVWYPKISYQQFSGCDFVSFNNDETLCDRDIMQKTPDYFFSKEEYAENILLLEYPHNLIHGVTIGKNSLSSDSMPHTPREFLSENSQNFIKDLIVITLSDEPNAED